MTALAPPSARRRPSARALDPALLTELRAALAAGVAPAEALALAAAGGPLASVAKDVRLGRGLGELAGDVQTGDPAADLLVRALAIAEATGAGAGLAVEQAVLAARDETALAELLRVRTVQARGTAVVLTGLPVAAWLFLVALDAELLAFYATAFGVATGVPAVLLALLGYAWSQRLVRRAEQAAAAADPLVPAPGPRDARRALALAVPALVLGTWRLGAGAGILLAAAAAGLGLRPRRPQPRPRAGAPRDAGGAAESVELLAVAVAAGLPVSTAVAEVAALAPPRARPALSAAARRLRGGWSADAAFADTGLAVLGRLLAACERWGAPAEDSLRRLAEDLRVARRTAAEAAAERVQLALVFPTTLLTLPAFVLGVVPPLLWSTLAG